MSIEKPVPQGQVDKVDKIGRRAFLRQAVMLTVSAGLAACAPLSTSAREEAKKPSGVDEGDSKMPSTSAEEIVSSESKNVVLRVNPEQAKAPSEIYGYFHYDGDDPRFIHADKFRAANSQEGWYVFVHSKGELYGTPLELETDVEGKVVATAISDWYVEEEFKGLGVINQINPYFYQKEEDKKVAITVLPPEYGFPAIVRKEGEKGKLYFAGVDSSYKIVHGPFDFFVEPGELAERYGYKGSPEEVVAVSMCELGSQLSGQLLVVPSSGESMALKFIGSLPTEKVNRVKTLGQTSHPVDIGSSGK